MFIIIPELNFRSILIFKNQKRDLINEISGTHMYTIGQVAKLVHLPISTIRYYDKEYLFPTLERTSGIRKFSEKELEALRMIECLKKSGLKIKEIKLFMEWCAQGSSTYEKRLELFLHQRKVVEEKIEKLEKVLDMIQFKCWYYEQALADGNEDRLKTYTETPQD